MINTWHANVKLHGHRIREKHARLRRTRRSWKCVISNQFTDCRVRRPSGIASETGHVPRLRRNEQHLPKSGVGRLPERRPPTQVAHGPSEHE